MKLILQSFINYMNLEEYTRMVCIYKALLDGWSVSYSKLEDTFVFTKREEQITTVASFLSKILA
jgi:hypothetical protein